MASANKNTGISRPLSRSLKLVDLSWLCLVGTEQILSVYYFSKQIDKDSVCLKLFFSKLKVFVLKGKQRKADFDEVVSE